MADGSTEERIGLKQMDDLTFSAPTPSLSDTKKCCEQSVDGDKVRLSFYTELETSNPCEKSDASSVVGSSTASVYKDFQKPSDFGTESAEERKKRCFDRYDSSESSDSGVAVLSPTESSGYSGSDITEPSSPRSPESEGSGTEESANTRMPPWVSEAPPAARRLAAQPAPTRRSQTLHRRITEYFNHKMKPHQPIKRECSDLPNADNKKKCLPKNGVTHDLEKYISYLSQTLSPKLLDVGKQPADTTTQKNMHPKFNGIVDSTKKIEFGKPLSNANGILDHDKLKDVKDMATSTMNGFVEFRHGNETKMSHNLVNGVKEGKKLDTKIVKNPSANGVVKITRQTNLKRKVPNKASSDMFALRIAPSSSVQGEKNKSSLPTPDSTKVNGVVSSTTKLDSRMNGVTCGSNNISLNPISSKPLQIKKEPIKKTMQTTKRTNRKSSACIANSKNMTWSKANNLKQQVQLQKQQNCVSTTQSAATSALNMPGEASTAPKMNIPNGVRQLSMTLNGNLSNINVPVNNLQNCHQLNIPSPYNGTVTSTNLASFVAVPQNVMLTTLRIPQNGIPAQTMNQQNNLGAFKPNVNMNSPTKLNGQFVFPLMQNINGAVVQIPNLMAKMPNFVLPQPQLAQRQDHLQNQQTTQFLINGTLLKLSNTMQTPYQNTNVNLHPNKPNTINKNGPGVPPMGVTMQTKPNYTVNLSHSMLMSQPGYIVTSVPNVNVKETWSYNLNTNSATTSCSNPIVHHPPLAASFTAQPMHSSSIPIAPVKPPDNPIQGTDPPSSTVKEPELAETKCDIPWLMKTVNNNIVSLDSSIKTTTRPFAQLGSFSNKVDHFITENVTQDQVQEDEIEKRTEVVKKEKDVNKMSMLSTEETVFTEIVVKDVSSDVSNTVIEANFCCTTTESSESGIGTDKSIDSPSDSQTSKECDEDSSLSLSVSVCSLDAQNSQKSPILKQPKTLRFPPRTKADNKRTSSTDTTSTVTLCLWENCGKEFDTDTELLSHLQSVHVESQAGKENYVCLWERCKVRGKPSCSSVWLERHASSHGGNKPFKCIVDGCEKRFSTQILLERHVNHHFTEASPSAGSSKKTTDSATKLIRRNGKKLRYRREPWSARMFDFFDAGIMEGVSWRLMAMSAWRAGGGCPLQDRGRHTLTLHAALAATRTDPADHTTHALLTYYPRDVIEDEWVPLEQVRRIKRVEIASLPAHTKVQLYEQFCASYRQPAAPAAAAMPPPPPPRARRRPGPPGAPGPPGPSVCSATNRPVLLQAAAAADRPSGARKRKMGRKYGGNSFWPCGR